MMGPSLLVRALLASLQDVAEKRGLVDFKVRHTVNRQGQLVVCIIVDAPAREPDKWRQMT